MLGASLPMQKNIETCHRSKDVSSGHTAASEPIFLLACWSELRYKKLTTDEDK